MRVLFAAGGTGGHINPALAAAQELRGRFPDARILFVGTAKKMEAQLVPKAGFDFKTINISGFQRSFAPADILHNIGTLRRLLFVTGQCKKIINEFKPDVVVGFGGYVSIPVARAAEQMGIPVVVHEQNSVMGLANKELSKKARAVCLTYECAKEGVAIPTATQVHVTGNPVRKKVLLATREEGRRMLGIPDDALMLLVFGGSLGARQLNEGIAALKSELLSRENLHVVHITGPKEFERTTAELALTEEEAKRWHVMGYQDRMGETLAATDAIVSRAGATSLAEISARAIPALLVPYPHATADHQTTNARAYVAAGCAEMIPDAEVGSEKFAQLVFSLVDDADVRAGMTAAAREQKTADAAAKLADVVMGTASSANHGLQ